MEKRKIVSNKGLFICEHCLGENGMTMSFTSYNSYLDHCNGRQHLKQIGVSTKQERVDDPEKIRNRLNMLRLRVQTRKGAHSVDAVNLASQRIEEQRMKDEEARKDRYARKKSAKSKKKMRQGIQSVIGAVEDAI